MSRSFKPLKRPALLLLAAASCLPLLVACERQSIPSAAVSETPKAEAAKAAPAPVYVCPMHPHITAHAPGTCPICGMDLVLKTPQASEPEASSESHSTPVSVSAQVMQTLGVRTVHALRRDIRPTIETTARVIADAGGEVRVQSRVEGFIERMAVRSTGAPVVAGAIIAEVYAPMLVQAQEEMLLGGEAAAGARERLRRFGIAERDIEAVRVAGVSSRRLPLRAPVGGIVTAIEVREGSRVGMDDVLVAIAVRSGLRVEAQVFPAQHARLGDTVEARFSLPGVAEKVWVGREAQWLSVIDPVTLTQGLRFRIDSDEGLAIGMLLDAELRGALREDVLMVPASAVIRTGAGDRVLREREPGVFEPVAVRVGQRHGDELEILEGLEAHDSVVASGTFLIDSEADLQAALARLQVGTGAHRHD